MCRWTAPVRCQCRRLQCGSVRIGSVVLESGVRLGGERHPRPHTRVCQQPMCNFHTRVNPLERTASEGMNNFLGHKGVPLPQREYPYTGLEALGAAVWTTGNNRRHAHPSLQGVIACRLAAPPGVDDALPPHALEDIAQGPVWLQRRPDLFRAEPCLTTFALKTSDYGCASLKYRVDFPCPCVCTAPVRRMPASVSPRGLSGVR